MAPRTKSWIELELWFLPGIGAFSTREKAIKYLQGHYQPEEATFREQTIFQTIQFFEV